MGSGCWIDGGWGRSWFYVERVVGLGCIGGGVLVGFIHLVDTKELV